MDDDDFTVGDLRRHLQLFDDDTKLSFSGGLTVYRVKDVGEGNAFVEFNEPQAWLDDAFKQRNPNVKAAFIRIDNVEWDEKGLLGGPVDVAVR
jgi:hypothetical protein